MSDSQLNYNAPPLYQFAKENIRRLRSQLDQLSLQSVKRILFINAPSRSGSSVLFCLLARLAPFFAPRGELVPFYKLNIPQSLSIEGCHDVLDTQTLDSIDFAALSEDILYDLSAHEFDPEIISSPLKQKIYFFTLMARLAIEWPEIQFDPQSLLQIISTSFFHHIKSAIIFNTEMFYIEILKKLHLAYPSINPYYYDINSVLLKQHFPKLNKIIGPPSHNQLIEEPPFILIHPDKLISQEMLENRILILKSSIDLYRIDLIRKLFPNAEIKTVFHLRNPAGSINGYYDGWQHQGFFSHNLKPFFDLHPHLSHLNIHDYTDKFAHGKYWWNYDLPPGWTEWISKPLMAVCAFQWRESAKRIYDLMNQQNSQYDFCLSTYEELTNNFETRFQLIKRIFNLFDLSFEPHANNLTLPIIQATNQPQPFRWLHNKEAILDVLDPTMLPIANLFNYSLNYQENWR